MLTFVMFSLFYRELKEALVLMVLLGIRAVKESKVVLHICTEEDRVLERLEFTIFSQVTKAHR